MRLFQTARATGFRSIRWKLNARDFHLALFAPWREKDTNRRKVLPKQRTGSLGKKSSAVRHRRRETKPNLRVKLKTRDGVWMRSSRAHRRLRFRQSLRAACAFTACRTSTNKSAKVEENTSDMSSLVLGVVYTASFCWLPRGNCADASSKKRVPPGVSSGSCLTETACLRASLSRFKIDVIAVKTVNHRTIPLWESETWLQ